MMDRDDRMRLMADALDRHVGPDDEARLAAFLASDPQAREQFEEAGIGARGMHELGRAPVPEGLREEIRRSVEREPLTARKGMSWFATWRAAFQKRPAFGLVPAFAVGAAVGIVIFASVSDHRLPIQGGTLPIGGTMQSPDQVSCAKLLERLDVGGAGFTAWRCGDHLTVTVSVIREATSRIDLAFDATALQTVSVRWPEGVEGIMEAGPGFVRLTPRGIGSCEIGLLGAENAARSINLAVSDAGETRRAILRTAP
jgi:hypothetical protein